MIPPALLSLIASEGFEYFEIEPLESCGLSGACLYRIVLKDGRRLVGKVTDYCGDWVARSTNDTSFREACFCSRLPTDLCVFNPAFASYVSEGSACIISTDLGKNLISPGPISIDQLGQLISAFSCLHSRVSIRDERFPWCSVENRLTLCSPGAKELSRQSKQLSNAVDQGWSEFFDIAPGDVGTMLRRLHADISPLVDCLDKFRPCVTHGDLKLDNIAIDGSQVALFDWSLVMRAPGFVDISWFLAANAENLPVELDIATDMYLSEQSATIGNSSSAKALIGLIGLVLRGFRIASTATEGKKNEFDWWCETAKPAMKLL